MNKIEQLIDELLAVIAASEPLPFTEANRLWRKSEAAMMAMEKLLCQSPDYPDDPDETESEEA
jgi:hypothetical protein